MWPGFVTFKQRLRGCLILIESAEENLTVRELIGHERLTKSGRMNLKTRFVEWKMRQKEASKVCASSEFLPPVRSTDGIKETAEHCD
jgi:hypothetical protein